MRRLFLGHFAVPLAAKKAASKTSLGTLLFAAGTAIYLSVTQERDRAGNLALWSLLGPLAVVYLASLFGPSPPSVQALAWSALAMWLTVP